MWRSSLVVATILIFSSVVFSQHSSGGGSSGGSAGGGSHNGSSSGGSSAGGGFHSSSGGSSASGHSASSHSSGGASSHGSSGPSSSVKSGSISTHPRVGEPQPKGSRTTREPKDKVQAGSENTKQGKPEGKPEKKGFFSFFRHPFRKHEPKPIAVVRRPICPVGPCRVCPPGLVRVGGGCVSSLLVRRHTSCSPWETWSGGACLQQTQFVDDCSGLRMALERQTLLMQTAEAARQSACAAGPTQMCSGTTIRAQSEASLYRVFQERYQRCRQSSMAYPFSGHAALGYSRGLMFDRLDADGVSLAEPVAQ